MENYIVINGVTYELVERTGLVTVPGSGLVAGPAILGGIQMRGR